MALAGRVGADGRGPNGGALTVAGGAGADSGGRACAVASAGVVSIGVVSSAGWLWR